jgi:hypothetical protein
MAVEAALERVNCGFSAAESHGICCGLLVVDQATDQQAWLAQVLEGDPQSLRFKDARTLLQELFTVTRQQMNDGDLSFALFLPDSDELETQVQAMQDWCQGFAFGIAAAGIKDMKKLPADSREWAEDVVRIGTSGEFDLDDAEESENAFVELVEYLRVGVLMMNEEMQPMKSSPQVH